MLCLIGGGGENGSLQSVTTTREELSRLSNCFIDCMKMGLDMAGGDAGVSSGRSSGDDRWVNFIENRDIDISLVLFTNPGLL